MERGALLALACVALANVGQAEKIACSENEVLETASVEPTDDVDEVAIVRCPPPAVSYAPTLASRFNITAVKKLILNHMPAEPALQYSHFTGLALSELTIKYDRSSSRNYIILNTSFLEPTKLELIYMSETVSLYNVNLPPLPQTARMEKVVLSHGQSLGAWGGCSNLRVLELYLWKVERVPELWLAHCSKLTALRIHFGRQMTTESLGRVLGGATSLRELKIYNCELRKIDLKLAHLVNLQNLYLSWNALRNISAQALPTSLTLLDLSHNQLWSSAQVAEVLQRLPALQDFSIGWNYKLNLCNEPAQDEVRQRRPSLQQLVLPSIMYLSAMDTATDRLCFGAMRTDSLTRLDLTKNYIYALKFRDLPVSKAPRLELKMDGNRAREVALEQADYEMLRDKVLVLGTYLTVACDCDHGWLARAVREGRVSIDNARCSDGEKIARVTPERMECDKFSCAGGACTCRRAWSDNATVARCDAAGNLSAVPRIPGLRALHAAGNRVRMFSADDLPDSLLLLDLARNNVSGADAVAAAVLFARPNRNVRLAGNPLRCDCENRALLVALQEHRAQVEDYKDVTCLYEGGLEVALQDVVPAILCTEQEEGQTWLTLVLGGSAALVGLAALAAALYYRYGRTVAVYMFTRGWCLNCVREEELDPDRPFDAFVSFAHEDEEFVTQRLLPGLDSEPHNYRLCLHTRDWVPGVAIPAQIARSVRLSRRTIIVLSRNFLQSVWGLLEFRMAHVSALSEGRVRVVVVVLDDVLDEGGLDPELHTYLRTHTYVQWGDPWFWRKLRYALPHRRMRAQRTDGTHVTAQAGTHDRDPGIELLPLPEDV